jgi:hypothetical protein
MPAPAHVCIMDLIVFLRCLRSMTHSR